MIPVVNLLCEQYYDLLNHHDKILDVTECDFFQLLKYFSNLSFISSKIALFCFSITSFNTSKIAN